MKPVFYSFRLRLALVVVVALCQTQHGTAEPAVSIISDADSPPTVRHGMDEITRALKEKQVYFEEAKSLESATGKTLLIAGLARGNGIAARLLPNADRSVPNVPEALAIQRIQYKRKPAWLIAGPTIAG